MTKKDYIIIAKVFARAKQDILDIPEYTTTDFNNKQIMLGVLESLVRFLAKQMLLDNPLFDKTKFYTACSFHSLLK